MGFVPKWSRADHKKTSSSAPKQGVRQMPSLFHGAKDAQYSGPNLFADGGEVDEETLKEEGLKASAGEKVGLWERLKAGNIDDPGSEAYRRFGAGRGRNERDMAAADKQMDQLDAMRRDTAARDAEFDAAEKQLNDLNKIKPTPAAAAPAPKFGEAFASARKSGATEFEWNGKKYNTKVKAESPAAPAKSEAPAASSEGNDMASVKSRMFRDAARGNETAKHWLRGMLNTDQLSTEETGRAKRLTGTK